MREESKQKNRYPPRADVVKGGRCRGSAWLGHGLGASGSTTWFEGRRRSNIGATSCCWWRGIIFASGLAATPAFFVMAPIAARQGWQQGRECECNSRRVSGSSNGIDVSDAAPASAPKAASSTSAGKAVRASWSVVDSMESSGGCDSDDSEFAPDLFGCGSKETPSTSKQRQHDSDSEDVASGDSDDGGDMTGSDADNGTGGTGDDTSGDETAPARPAPAQPSASATSTDQRVFRLLLA